jgi:hypothetical protein
VGLKSLKSLNLTNEYPNNKNNNKKNNNKLKSKPLELRSRVKSYMQYCTHNSYVLVVHTLRVAENEILKLDLPAKRH